MSNMPKHGSISAENSPIQRVKRLLEDETKQEPANMFEVTKFLKKRRNCCTHRVYMKLDSHYFIKGEPQ